MPSRGKRAMGKITVWMSGRIRETTVARCGSGTCWQPLVGSVGRDRGRMATLDRHGHRAQAGRTVASTTGYGGREIRALVFGTHRSEAMPGSRGQMLSGPASCLAAVALAA